MTICGSGPALYEMLNHLIHTLYPGTLIVTIHGAKGKWVRLDNVCNWGYLAAQDRKPCSCSSILKYIKKCIVAVIWPSCSISLENTSLCLKWRGGSVGRAWDSRSKDPRFEPCLHQEHRKKMWEFSRVKNAVLTRCRCAQPLCAYARIRMITYAR